jgi:hypothetical protein
MIEKPGTGSAGYFQAAKQGKVISRLVSSGYQVTAG